MDYMEEALDPVLEAILDTLPVAHSLLHSTAVNRQFRIVPEENYTVLHDINILAGTYNVNGRKPDPSTIDISSWLQGASAADLVVVGFQEVVPLNASSVVLGSGLEAILEWDGIIESHLNQKEGEKKQFVNIACQQLVGIYLTVWATEALIPNLRGVEVCSVGTGILGFIGNKGGVAVRMRIFDSSLCIVNCHLSSGSSLEALKRRNLDYAEICRRGLFAASEQPAPGGIVQTKPGVGVSKIDHRVNHLDGHWNVMAPTSIFDGIEHCIFNGDMNYRLSGIETAQIHAYIQEGNLEELLNYDELRNSVINGEAFQGGWSEGAIRFPPTFKLLRGTDKYLGSPECPDVEVSTNGLKSSSTASLSDLPTSGDITRAPSQQLQDKKEKVRPPAYTDRILYKSNSGNMRLIDYDSARDIYLSDHFPVRARLVVKAKEYVKSQIVSAVEHAQRVVDAQEMAATPHLDIEPRILDAGIIRYDEPKELQITASASNSSVEFEFCQLPGSASSLPSWLSAEPSKGVVKTGESTTIRLTVHVVDGCDAEEALAKKGVLDAILVLRAARGNDCFISVAGNYQPSCFGLRIGTLLHLDRPLIKQDSLETAETIMNDNTVPIELLRLTHYLESCDQPPTLYETFTRVAERYTSSDYNVARVRDCLDRGIDFTDDITARDVAAALLRFLGALPEPLLSASLEAAYSNFNAQLEAKVCWSLVKDNLDQPELCVLQHVIGFFSNIVLARDKQGQHYDVVAEILSDVLYKTLPQGVGIRSVADDMSKLSLEELQAVADSFNAQEANRIEFVKCLLS